jgi:site-specific DNA-methyltransferase (adenine-specific)/modification methylase
MVYKRKEVIGDATLYLGDCLQIMPTLGKVDAVVTDPPFGVGNFVQNTGNIRGEKVEWNNNTPNKKVFDVIKNISTHRIIWGANYFNCFEENGGAIVWIKNQPMPNFSKCEIASCSHLKKTEVFNITWTNFVNTKESNHPCERPSSLYEMCINYLPYSETILDPFMGSGTTGVACANLGRKFIGVELEERYFDIACKRIDQAQRQGKLFSPPKPKPEQGRLL